jgi:hypothetical protein
LLQVRSPIFEAEFSDPSYGYRPNRSAHEAVEAARGYVRAGKDGGIDLAISAFFDEGDPDILMAKVGRKVRDQRGLRLIGSYLRAPIQQAGRLEQRGQGTPHGGPLSPLLSTLSLDGLDQELERRGLSFCRYADDGAVFGSSERSGERALASLTDWIAKHLKLRLNTTKSGGGAALERQGPGVADHQRGANRPGQSQPGEAESQGAGGLGCTDQGARGGTDSTLAAIPPRLVELLPPLRSAAKYFRVGRLDAAPPAEILLAALAQSAQAVKCLAPARCQAVPSEAG